MIWIRTPLLGYPKVFLAANYSSKEYQGFAAIKVSNGWDNPNALAFQVWLRGLHLFFGVFMKYTPWD